MLGTALVTFTTLFATVGPPDVAAIFAVLTSKKSPAQKRAIAVKGVLIAAGILVFFALLGEAALKHLGITLAAFRTAGGILLLLIAIDMVFARASGGVTATREETDEAAAKEDISVFPLATPLIAGPGAIGAVILLTANAHGDWRAGLMVFASLALVLAITLVLMLAASQVQKLLGVTGLHVVSRVLGVLLTALAVQFVFDGVRASGLLS